MLSVSDSESVILKFRFLCCQEQLLFLCDALNIIDLLDLLIFVAYAITRSLAIQQYGPERHFLISIMHKTRLLCVARLFKLCRHSRGLRLVFYIRLEWFEKIWWEISASPCLLSTQLGVIFLIIRSGKMWKTYERILTTTIAQSKYVLLELLSMQIMFSIIFGAFMVSQAHWAFLRFDSCTVIL